MKGQHPPSAISFNVTQCRDYLGMSVTNPSNKRKLKNYSFKIFNPCNFLSSKWLRLNNNSNLFPQVHRRVGYRETCTKIHIRQKVGRYLFVKSEIKGKGRSTRIRIFYKDLSRFYTCIFYNNSKK